MKSVLFGAAFGIAGLVGPFPSPSCETSLVFCMKALNDYSVTTDEHIEALSKAKAEARFWKKRYQQHRKRLLQCQGAK